MSRKGMPMGISTRPLFRTLPESVKILVPLLSVVPMDEYHSPPLPMMIGMFEKVSALLMTVGLPQSPATAGNGGRTLGMARLPSMDSMRAVSSPQMNASVPKLNSMSKSKPIPNTFGPRKPFSRACSMAVLSRSTDRWYRSRMYRYPFAAQTAYAPMSMPSMMAWGLPSARERFTSPT